MALGRTDEDEQDDEFYGIEYLHEALLPSIAEPISSFDFEKNKDMYYFMTKEMRGHVDRVTGTLSDAMKKTNREFPTTYHTSERNREIYESIEESLKDKPYPDAEARRKAAWLLYRKKQAEDDERLKVYIKQRAMQPYRDAKQWRQERIAELQEELRRLTKEEEQEQQQQEKDVALPQTLLPPPPPTHPAPSSIQKQKPEQEKEIV